MTTSADVGGILAAVEEKAHVVNLFRSNVVSFFEQHPTLRSGNPAAIHSIKSRSKSETSLRHKIARKMAGGRSIDPDNVFEEITDLGGVRVLHLLQEHFPEIHNAIQTHVADGEWWMAELPQAYTWDPDAKEFFEKLGLNTELKDTRYTSVHYVVRPREGAPASCEIQVRTLWEEIWGEVDHALNYPESSYSVACREQLRVLARLVATGTRLADSIFMSHRESAAQLHDAADEASPHC